MSTEFEPSAPLPERDAEAERLRADLADAEREVRALRTEQRSTEAEVASLKFTAQQDRQEIRRMQETVRESRVLPCDGICIEYAEEDCSRHGRAPAELWAMLSELNAEKEALLAEVASLRDTLARSVNLSDWERLRDTLASERAEHARTRAQVGRVEALCEKALADPRDRSYSRLWVSEVRRALSPDAEPNPETFCPDCGPPHLLNHDNPEASPEPERCPHVAEPGSRHEDEGA